MSSVVVTVPAIPSNGARSKVVFGRNIDSFLPATLSNKQRRFLIGISSAIDSKLGEAMFMLLPDNTTSSTKDPMCMKAILETATHALRQNDRDKDQFYILLPRKMRQRKWFEKLVAKLAELQFEVLLFTQKKRQGFGVKVLS